MVGRPTMAEVGGPWLLPIIGAIFGSYDSTAQRRMINEFFWLIPKKNGKSSSAAAIMVEALILNERPEGEYVLVAPTKEIADISFKQASGTIRADAELTKLFQIQFHIRTITHRRTGATLKVKAADTDVITGGKQVGTLIDELHVLAAKKNAADILVELRGALAARPDGFLIVVTTQSKAPPQGVFKSELAKARAVRDGKLSLPLLPILYELPSRLQVEDGWKDRRLWPAVNPNLGRSVDEAFLVRELEAAETAGQAQLLLFASQHFNVEIGLALASDGWTGAEYWEAAADPTLTLDALLARCDVVTIGIDGGGLDDLYGFCVIGRERGDGDVRFRRWLCWNHTWCARVAVERRKSEAAKYADFEAAEELTIVDNLDDAEVEMAGIIKRIHDAGLLAGVGMDPVGAKSLVDKLECAGVPTDLIAAVSQGYKLNGPIVDCERRLFSRTLIHCGQAIMAWAVSNCKIELKGNAVVITKQASGKAKIDPLMALFDAVALMSNNPEPASAGAPEIFAL
jgi:phage terminase large subunit-like protein